MYRLEFKDKKSSKFWEAEVEGKALLTRWGRIGTDGQTLKKKFPDEYNAKQAMEAGVAEKLKKGYQRAKTAREIELEKPPAKAAKRNKELEASILEDMDSADPWLVYADWLQGEGDPRGELVVVQHSLEKKKDKKLRDREAKILEEHGALLLGPLRKFTKTLDSKASEVFTWHRGFLRSIRIAYNQYAQPSGAEAPDVPAMLAQILAHPSAALVQEIVLGEYNTGKWDDKAGSSQLYQPLLDAIAKAKPQGLRRLVVGDYEFPDETEISWTCMGSLGKIWKAAPRLERVRVQGGKIGLGTIEAPNLREAAFVTGGLPRAALKSIAAANWPRLERLEVWLGAEEYGGGGKVEDLAPIFEGKGLPKLKHLGLKNSEFQNEIAAAIGSSKILKKLETLDLSMGTLTDEGAASLAKHGAAFRHLALLDVSDSYLGKEGRSTVAKLAKKVESGEQRESDEDGDETYRYVSVGE